MKRILKVGLCQISTRLGDIETNKRKILDCIRRAREENIDIILTPELATMGFGSGDIYLDKVEENLEALDEIREYTEKTNLWAIVGYVEKDPLGFFYNAACLIAEGKILGNYRKVQLVNYRLFDEKRYFRSGRHLPVFDTPYGKIGILICEDIWFPEPVRIVTLRGAEIVFVLSASPFSRSKVSLWKDYLRIRAFDNILPIAFANQAGIQDGVTYWGGSMLVDATGEVIAEAKLTDEDFVIAPVDIAESRRLRRRDIRIREIRREILEELMRAYEESE